MFQEWIINKRINVDGEKIQKKPSEKKETKKSKQVVISQECPMCHHPEMYFFTIQMRSADEGSTVFYECVKCQYNKNLCILDISHFIFLAIKQHSTIREHREDIIWIIYFINLF